MRYVTCLPVFTNEGRTTEHHRATFYGTLARLNCDFNVQKGFGIWYDGDTRYAERVMRVSIDMSPADYDTIVKAVKDFGRDCEQLAMLWVKADDIVASGEGEETANRFALEHGGCTLLGDGTAISYVYSAFENGIDYKW